MKATMIVSGGAAAAAVRLDLARAGICGTEVRSIGQVAARLAGGFAQDVETEALLRACTEVLAEASPDALGDLATISDLPGLPGAVAATLRKTWEAGLDLSARAESTPQRLTVLARLEADVLALLPAAMLAPPALVSRALARVRLAPVLLGPVSCRGLADLAPCWRPLLAALAATMETVWDAGPRVVPGWVRNAGIPVRNAPATAPELRAVSCATARHEVTEALRWARGLLASGTVRAEDIAFAAASPGEFDDLVLALSDEANLPVHFAHGRRALATRPGQAAAALADLLLRGLSQTRVRRLVALAAEPGAPLAALPEDWTRHLPSGAPLGSLARWQQALAGTEIAGTLLPIVALCAEGIAAAERAGEAILRGQARSLWRAALAAAPAAALEASLAGLRLPDTEEPGAAIAWMHAASLAACPRPHVWLLGLNAHAWPRQGAEDPLLPDHLLGRPLAWRGLGEADRAAFHAIRATTAGSLVTSARRRDATGRLVGLSPLLPRDVPLERLRRTRIPAHAMSEQDRMMARPAEFAATARAEAADACWQAWHRPEITAHDGQMRADHPAILRALDRVHSASSLKTLLRNPLGFVWRYALGWREPDESEEALNLDASAFGSLVHAMLDEALLLLAKGQDLDAAIAASRAAVNDDWASLGSVPPALLWAARLDEGEAMARTALRWPLPKLPGQRSLSELTFGGGEARGDVPGDTTQPIPIPGTSIRIAGRIDRLDLSGDGRQARVVDYKTGKVRDPGTLDGGKELQRCLYAFAAQALLGPGASVEAALLYPREGGGYYPLPDQAASLATLTAALGAACSSLRKGCAQPGPDTGGDYDDLRFALPAATGSLAARKAEAARVLLGEAVSIWEAE